MPQARGLFAAFAALLFAPVAFGLGCSSSSPAPSGSTPCSALEACCASLSGDEATSCQNGLAGATSSQCASALSALVQAGGCTASGFDAGSGFDGALPCTLTGTCADGGGSSGSGSGGGSPDGGIVVGPQCVAAGACQDGETYSTCVETSSSGACNAAIVFPDGATYACASCNDCAAASVSAESYCASMTPGPDAGDDTGSACGTAPVLHPETTPGVYCPFTEAGSIHCATAQQCCETPSTIPNGSTCQALTTSCPVAGSLGWECDGPVDCQGNAGGSICCAAGTVALDPVCGFDRGTGLTGSFCATSCASNELQICAATTDPCAAGTQCTAFKVAGVVLGACL